MTDFPTARAETRTAAIAAPPSAVLAVIADPRRIPEWAPDFAVAVQPAGELWRIDQGEGELLVDHQVNEAAGTVDFVRPGDTSRGARIRALASGDGTELLFTILFPPDTPDGAVGAQMAVVERELVAIGALAREASARAISSPRAD